MRRPYGVRHDAGVLTPAAPRVVVVGAGMAGVSIGYELARDHDVVVLEAVALPAQHSTGRSAALFFADYGPPAVREFSRRSLPLFAELEQSLATPSLLGRRGALLVATDASAADALDAWMSGSAMRPATVAACAELCPVLDTTQLLHAGYDASACDIDVMALHDGYARGLRARGGQIAYKASVISAERTPGGWRVCSGDKRVWDCDFVVNAAGAWGDEVWAAFGVHGHGLIPCRRTVAVARSATPVEATWPIVGDAAEAWYFKPEGGGILVSPSDETASVPRDEKPDPLDVACALDRVNAVTSLDLRSVVTAWAGQRTFTSDHLPVVGAHPSDDSLFSFVGQGGYGIQSAPALARAAAQMLRGSERLGAGCDLSAFSPDRPGVRGAAVTSAAGANLQA
jgi:D-arginine dehydrogenase